MSVIGSNILAGASGQGGDYTIARSLRFRSSASAYLNRTPASAGNRKTWTWSGWVKRGALGSFQYLYGAGGGSNDTTLAFYADDTFACFLEDGAGSSGIRTTQVFRDPSAWYHIVVQLDTTQATNTNRLKIYINGSQVTTFGTANYPTQNTDWQINNTVAHNLGRARGGSYYDGYTTEVNFIDGQSLTPSSFGATNASTGVWQPKKYAGTYGTNGFYLPFTNNSTTTTLGNDFSGNGNNWTTNNISLTAGSTYDSMTDVPTLTSSTVANYCTINPLAASSIFDIISVSQANLYVGLRNAIILSTMGSRATGKYYWEITADSNELLIGVATPQVNLNASYPRFVGNDPFSWGYYTTTGVCYYNGSVVTSTGVTATTGDVIGVALDLDNQKLFVSKNGTFLNSGNPVSGTGAIFTNISNTDFVLPAISDGGGTVAKYSYHNYGQRPFAYTPPTGFVALNTFNLPTPTIGATASTQANKYFDVLTWTGNGSNPRSFTGLNFAPDFVWAKNRSVAYTHSLYDIVRGAGANKELISASTSAEGGGNQDEFGYLSSFDSAGFTSAAGSTGQNYYFNDVTYPAFVAWNWKANGAGVTNTAGSITSTVSANTSAGFSIVTYTGTGSNATIGHGLGVAPSMIIVKSRSNLRSWNIYHASLGNTKAIYLNLTNAADTNSAFWNNTSPASSVFTVGSAGDMNANGENFVAYCFSEVAGYSKFGSYVGNGSADGPFVYLGFRPRYIVIKKSSGTGSWYQFDSARSPSNIADKVLYPDLSNAEGTFAAVDFVSNGFKWRSDGSNDNGATFIYMAFCESPFKYSLGR